MARSHSLLRCKKYPVRTRREFPSTALKLLSYSTHLLWDRHTQRAKFPVFSQLAGIFRSSLESSAEPPSILGQRRGASRPYGMGTYGSRSLAVGGTAIVKAMDKVIPHLDIRRCPRGCGAPSTAPLAARRGIGRAPQPSPLSARGKGRGEGPATDAIGRARCTNSTTTSPPASMRSPIC
jgi:hypothetical protein